MTSIPAPSFQSLEPPGGAATAAAPEAETWKLEDLYPAVESFREAFQTVRKRIPDVEKWAGRLGESASTLAEALDAIDDVAKELRRVYAYAALRADVDTRIPTHQAARQEVELLWNELTRRTAYLRPEILAIEPLRLDRFLREHDALAPHAQYLRNLSRQRDHVLTPAEEGIMAHAGLVTGASSSLYNVLHNAELPRRDVRLSDGTAVRLDPASFARHRTTVVRDDREMLFREYFRAYGEFRETLGLNLYESLKVHMFRARARGYDSCLEAALDGDNVPTDVYRNLVAQIHERLPVLHRYMGLRQRYLGLPRLGYHDLHCALAAETERRYTVAEASDLVSRSMEPLGARYAEALENALQGRWTDWHPTPGKRSGAYAVGSAYDVHPYVLMNFNSDYESVSTLTHELGHALHSYFSNRTQPYASADYSIFVAEVASTFNEALLNHLMLEESTSDQERVFLLGTFLDQFRTTLFRQTMFAEFEALIHERAEAGEALTGEKLSEAYLELLRRYHGHDDGVVEIPDRYGIEWAGVPHFYYDFYVYQYSTGIVAATALAEAVLEDRPGARDRYLGFLASGGSDYPLALLREAGVDLQSPEPYDLTARAIRRALDRLEALLPAPA